jgi:transcriptional regulator with XRE-family HTH domain
MPPPPVLATLNLDRLRSYYEAYAKECGARVRSRRLMLKLTLADMAELTGLPMQTISKVELGEFLPRDYLKAALALRLACEVAELWPTVPREVLAREAAA